MRTIGQLAQTFKLSRSTLLYYDRIELLSPSGRSEAGYRLYSDADHERLKSICAYRDAGLSLEDIRTVIDNVEMSQREILENRLRDISLNIQTLKQQQNMLAGLLKIKAQGEPFEQTGKRLWVEMFKAAGMDETAMRRWHQEFELRAPDDHHAFLLSLDISEKEALQIRKLSANMDTNVMEMEYFYRLYEAVDRYAPGTDRDTLRALNQLPELPEKPRVLDIGCGCGVQTLTLAGGLKGGEIIAIDNHQPFLDKLAEKAASAALSTRVTPLQASMFDLPFSPGSFDLIWAEGSIYIVGFAEGLKRWKPLLKTDGYVVLTDMVWLREDPPEEIRAYWTTHNPALTDIPQCLEKAKAAGYKLIDHFTLPAQGWTEYYQPLRDKISDFREELAWNDAAETVFAATEEEARMYELYGEWYGYEFILLQNS